MHFQSLCKYLKTANIKLFFTSQRFWMLSLWQTIFLFQLLVISCALIRPLPRFLFDFGSWKLGGYSPNRCIQTNESKLETGFQVLVCSLISEKTTCRCRKRLPKKFNSVCGWVSCTKLSHCVSLCRCIQSIQQNYIHPCSPE